MMRAVLRREQQVCSPKPYPPRERLHELFRYEDGRLYNRDRRGRHLAGTEAGTIGANGYRYVSINKQFYLQHRLIWIMFHGDQPYRVDHRDRDQLNNRIENLRAATQSLNAFNARLRRNNTSGFVGVNQVGSSWHAQIKCNGRKILLGCFGSMQEAIAARQAGELKYFGELTRRDAA